MISRTPRSPWAEKRLISSATIRRASMSSPESVSSRIANRGFSSSSWTISCRFFTAREALVDIPIGEIRVHPTCSSGDDLFYPRAELRRLTIQSSLGRAKEVWNGDTGHLDGYCIGEEKARPGPLIHGERQQVGAIEGHRP